MSEKNQSAKDAEDILAKKPWYKNWWVIFLIILLFPILVPYLVWTKTNWNKWIKITITIFCVILFISIMADSESDTTSSSQKNQKEIALKETEIDEGTTNEQFEVVFDIPSLLDKDIDEIREILGEPVDEKEPPEDTLQDQKQLGEDFVMKTWGNTFESEDFGMYVTFYIKDRKVKDFFLSTDDSSGKTKDKQKLLQTGNLNEDDSNYSLNFIETINDKNYFTGVKVEKIDKDD